MATPLPMPKLGLTMEAGTILKWLKSDGEPVEKGEIIVQIQTDKVEYDVESPGGGLLLKTLAAEGDEVACGVDIAVIGEEGEDISGFSQAATAGGGATAAAPEAPAPATPAPAPAAPAAPPAPAPATPAPAGGRIFASPAARRVARELGIAYRTLKGTGPNGRIVQADVRAAASGGVPAAPLAPPAAASGPAAVARTVPVAGMRKVIV
ncbi:MAG: E3 binding domain-containing protein, partial [bacterium]